MIRESSPESSRYHDATGGSLAADVGLLTDPVFAASLRHRIAETDAPYQAPEAHRGGRSEPAFVASVIARLAAARGATASGIAALTTANARRIFAAW